jgi:hypothetical protein
MGENSEPYHTPREIIENFTNVWESQIFLLDLLEEMDQKFGELLQDYHALEGRFDGLVEWKADKPLQGRSL